MAAASGNLVDILLLLLYCGGRKLPSVDAFRVDDGEDDDKTLDGGVHACALETRRQAANSRIEEDRLRILENVSAWASRGRRIPAEVLVSSIMVSRNFLCFSLVFPPIVPLQFPGSSNKTRILGR